MRYIKSLEFVKECKNMKRKMLCTIYIDEYATMWQMSMKFFGYESPSAVAWRYKKSEYANDVEKAMKRFINDVEERWD